MQIKHKLLLWFAALVMGLLLALAGYVYVSTARFRAQTFAERLARKAALTQQVLALGDSAAGAMLVSLPEQTQYVYDPAGQPVYTAGLTPDFQPSAAWLGRARTQDSLAFTYPSPGHAERKEGMALSYRRPGAPGRYVTVVTAYDQEGHAELHRLRQVLGLGMLGAVAVVGALGWLFAVRALAPLTLVIGQLRTPRAGTAGFRLRPANVRDEVGQLALAFNDLLARQETLAESQRAFISHASHELRTPLTTLKGWLETSLAYDQDAASLRVGLGRAVQELDRLTALTNGLLYLAWLDGPDPSLPTSPLDLVDTLLEVVSTAQRQYAGQPFNLDLSEGVQQQTQAPTLLGHASLLRTALGNLVDNAAKYSAGQPVEVCLEMDTEAAVRVRIEDRGPGIRPDEAERLFEPLTRGRDVPADVPGFGIGLTLARRIIERHGGTLHLRPRPGGGTVAEVRLPLARG
ncbi:HAMP domain-containing sensor histidine kinase [Hymenobacter ginsengisoli]|uniref:histidine kinase n=1 Tax=Hymenobacter ginsengisoli TaxID=1051626 RepID=A0ABP8QHS8_9BACT|nr:MULTISPECIES: HAMP domain-containing sensor histidine kinase [unclassified Hymenobacter]MBO2029904.1 HAMP domain-containing histidine kinase [Hymenobacter sp. BT559]